MRISKRKSAVVVVETPEQILARSEAKARVLGIIFVGSMSTVLVLGGVAAIFFAPDRAKDVWLIVGPIVTGAISGMLGFWASARRRRA
jgi:hypothetical protein